MAILTKEAILAAEDIHRVTVDVPEWGGEVIIQEMDARSMMEFSLGLLEDDPQLREKMLASCLVDEQGERIFALADVAALGKKNFDVIKRLSDRCFELNKYGRKALEAAQENFSAIPSGASPSD